MNDIFDRQEAIERLEDAELVDELIGDYLEMAEDVLPKLKEKIESKDHEGVRQNAHSLKGASSNLSMHRLTNACFELEKAGKSADESRYSQLYQNILEEYQKLKQFLKEQKF